MKDLIQQIIKDGLKESIEIKSKILDSNLLNQIENASELIVKCLQEGGKIFFAGNGGSFADSQHLAAEFISRFLFNRSALPAVALGTNSSSMSAISNDYNYKDVFSRELEALASNKDIFIPISTSGNSTNLIEAVKTAKIKGIKIVAFTGETGGALNELCECIKVPSTDVARIQECHILIGHLCCQIVEKKIFRPDE
jgi:D-sedoheptulose 7-phosphate isomerase